MARRRCCRRRPQDASRFLAQATFGATDADIHTLTQIGFTAWLNQQFTTPPTLHEPVVEQSLMLNNPPCATGDVMCNAALFVQNSSDEGYLQQTFLAAGDDGQRSTAAAGEVCAERNDGDLQH